MKYLRYVVLLAGLVGWLGARSVAASPTFAPSHVVFLPWVPNGFPSPLNVDPYAHGSVGYDISFPACGDPPPPPTSSNGAPYRFAVVGVNGGRAFETNPCFAAEYASAVGQGLLVSFYMNINAPIGSTAANGDNGPKGACAPGDDVCLSYNYGFNAASYAYSSANAAVGYGGVVGRVWWLDVETANSWWTDQNPPPPNAAYLDDQVVQGAIDVFHQNGVAVGSYSIATMWQERAIALIAGAMGHLAPPVLRPQILGSFQPHVPEWVSGAADLLGAPLLCGAPSFTAGPIWLTQRPMDNYYDEDYAC